MTGQYDTTVDSPQARTGAGFDAAAWLRRWDHQQAGYVIDRDEMFGLMLDVAQRLGAAPGRALDLGCGPGSLAARVLDRFPGAHVTGVDIDPVLLEIGRRTLGDRIRWVEADLRTPSWHERLEEPQRFDIALSATALHWLDPGHLPHLAEGLAARIRPGGVFLNYDTMLADPAQPRLAELTEQLRLALRDRTVGSGGSEDWESWWAALAEEPELVELLAERDRRFGDRRHSTVTTITHFEQAFRDAGFTEVGTLTQVTDRRLLVAIR